VRELTGALQAELARVQSLPGTAQGPALAAMARRVAEAQAAHAQYQAATPAEAAAAAAVTADTSALAHTIAAAEILRFALGDEATRAQAAALGVTAPAGPTVAARLHSLEAGLQGGRRPAGVDKNHHAWGRALAMHGVGMGDVRVWLVTGQPSAAIEAVLRSAETEAGWTAINAAQALLGLQVASIEGQMLPHTVALASGRPPGGEDAALQAALEHTRAQLRTLVARRADTFTAAAMRGLAQGNAMVARAARIEAAATAMPARRAELQRGRAARLRQRGERMRGLAQARLQSEASHQRRGVDRRRASGREATAQQGQRLVRAYGGLVDVQLTAAAPALEQAQGLLDQGEALYPGATGHAAWNARRIRTHAGLAAANPREAVAQRALQLRYTERQIEVLDQGSLSLAGKATVADLHNQALALLVARRQARPGEGVEPLGEEAAAGDRHVARAAALTADALAVAQAKDRALLPDLHRLGAQGGLVAVDHHATAGGPRGDVIAAAVQRIGVHLDALQSAGQDAPELTLGHQRAHHVLAEHHLGHGAPAQAAAALDAAETRYSALGSDQSHVGLRIHTHAALRSTDRASAFLHGVRQLQYTERLAELAPEQAAGAHQAAATLLLEQQQVRARSEAAQAAQAAAKGGGAAAQAELQAARAEAMLLDNAIAAAARAPRGEGIAQARAQALPELVRRSDAHVAALASGPGTDGVEPVARTLFAAHYHADVQGLLDQAGRSEGRAARGRLLAEAVRDAGARLDAIGRPTGLEDAHADSYALLAEFHRSTPAGGLDSLQRAEGALDRGEGRYAWIARRAAYNRARVATHQDLRAHHLADAARAGIDTAAPPAAALAAYGRALAHGDRVLTHAELRLGMLRGAHGPSESDRPEVLQLHGIAAALLDERISLRAGALQADSVALAMRGAVDGAPKLEEALQTELASARAERGGATAALKHLNEHDGDRYIAQQVIQRTARARELHLERQISNLQGGAAARAQALAAAEAQGQKAHALEGALATDVGAVGTLVARADQHYADGLAVFGNSVPPELAADVGSLHVQAVHHHADLAEAADALPGRGFDGVGRDARGRLALASMEQATRLGTHRIDLATHVGAAARLGTFADVAPDRVLHDHLLAARVYVDVDRAAPEASRLHATLARGVLRGYERLWQVRGDPGDLAAYRAELPVAVDKAGDSEDGALLQGTLQSIAAREQAAVGLLANTIHQRINGLDYYKANYANIKYADLGESQAMVSDVVDGIVWLSTLGNYSMENAMEAAMRDGLEMHARAADQEVGAAVRVMNQVHGALAADPTAVLPLLAAAAVPGSRGEALHRVLQERGAAGLPAPGQLAHLVRNFHPQLTSYLRSPAADATAMQDALGGRDLATMDSFQAERVAHTLQDYERNRYSGLAKGAVMLGDVGVSVLAPGAIFKGVGMVARTATGARVVAGLRAGAAYVPGAMRLAEGGAGLYRGMAQSQAATRALAGAARFSAAAPTTARFLSGAAKMSAFVAGSEAAIGVSAALTGHHSRWTRNVVLAANVVGPHMTVSVGGARGFATQMALLGGMMTATHGAAAWVQDADKAAWIGRAITVLVPAALGAYGARRSARAQASAFAAEHQLLPGDAQARAALERRLGRVLEDPLAGRRSGDFRVPDGDGAAGGALYQRIRAAVGETVPPDRAHALAAELTMARGLQRAFRVAGADDLPARQSPPGDGQIRRILDRAAAELVQQGYALPEAYNAAGGYFRSVASAHAARFRDAPRGARSPALAAAWGRAADEGAEVALAQQRLGAGGAARGPAFEWRQNAGGQVRTVAEAVAIARQHGVEIGDDIFIGVADDFVPPGAYASYGQLGSHFRPGDEVLWTDLLNRRGKVPVRLHSSVLKSDEAIVAVLAHEMYELNRLRQIFIDNDGGITAGQLHRLVAEGYPTNLHARAWDESNRLIAMLRDQAPAPSAVDAAAADTPVGPAADGPAGVGMAARIRAGGAAAAAAGAGAGAGARPRYATEELDARHSEVQRVLGDSGVAMLRQHVQQAGARAPDHWFGVVVQQSTVVVRESWIGAGGAVYWRSKRFGPSGLLGQQGTGTYAGREVRSYIPKGWKDYIVDIGPASGHGMVFRPKPGLDHNGAMYYRVELPRRGLRRLPFVGAKEFAGAPRPETIRADQLIGLDGQPLPHLGQVAVFSAHGWQHGFVGVSTRQAAKRLVAEILAFNRGKRPADQIRYIALSSCAQGNRGFVYFGETNAQRLMHHVRNELRLSNLDMDTLTVLASDRPGSVYGNQHKVSRNGFVDIRYVHAQSQRPAIDSTEGVLLPVGVAAATALGIGLGHVIAEIRDARQGTADE
jgi:hypothetical protein